MSSVESAACKKPHIASRMSEASRIRRSRRRCSGWTSPKQSASKAFSFSPVNPLFTDRFPRSKKRSPIPPYSQSMMRTAVPSSMKLPANRSLARTRRVASVQILFDFRQSFQCTLKAVRKSHVTFPRKAVVIPHGSERRKASLTWRSTVVTTKGLCHAAQDVGLSNVLRREHAPGDEAPDDRLVLGQ